MQIVLQREMYASVPLITGMTGGSRLWNPPSKFHSIRTGFKTGQERPWRHRKRRFVRILKSVLRDCQLMLVKLITSGIRFCSAMALICLVLSCWVDCQFQGKSPYALLMAQCANGTLNLFLTTANMHQTGVTIRTTLVAESGLLFEPAFANHGNGFTLLIPIPALWLMTGAQPLGIIVSQWMRHRRWHDTTRLDGHCPGCGKTTQIKRLGRKIPIFCSCGVIAVPDSDRPVHLPSSQRRRRWTIGWILVGTAALFCIGLLIASISTRLSIRSTNPLGYRIDISHGALDYRSSLNSLIKYERKWPPFTVSWKRAGMGFMTDFRMEFDSISTQLRMPFVIMLAFLLLVVIAVTLNKQVLLLTDRILFSHARDFCPYCGYRLNVENVTKCSECGACFSRTAFCGLV